MLSVLVRVRDALQAAERDDQVEDFLRRAQDCLCREELMRLAREYVELDE